MLPPMGVLYDCEVGTGNVYTYSGMAVTQLACVHGCNESAKGFQAVVPEVRLPVVPEVRLPCVEAPEPVLRCWILVGPMGSAARGAAGELGAMSV